MLMVMMEVMVVMMMVVILNYTKLFSFMQTLVTCLLV